LACSRLDRILIWENALRESCTDDGDVLFAFHIELVEIPPGYERNAERCKESGRNDTEARARILLAGGAHVTFRRELEAGIAAITPGHLAAKYKVLISHYQDWRAARLVSGFLQTEVKSRGEPGGRARD
jgi:hypothetical protein